MKKKRSIKDIIIIIILIILICYTIYSHIKQNGENSISTIFEPIVLLIISFVGFIEICIYLDWLVFVPNFLITAKENKFIRNVGNHMDAYFKSNSFFLQAHQQEEIDYIMSQLGLSPSSFDKIKLDIIRLRGFPVQDIEDARKKVKYLVGFDAVTIDQKLKDPSEINYNLVQYYINFIDIMFIKSYADQITSIYELLITETLKDKIKEITKIVVPFDSNFLLGFELSKRMCIPIVTVRKDKGRILCKQKWDGNLKLSDKVIVIHDVLVTGNQITESLDNLSAHCEVIAVFCLIVRKEYNGKKLVEERGITVHQLLELDDKDISVMIKNGS